MVTTEVFSNDETLQGVAGVPERKTCPYCGKELVFQGLRLSENLIWWCPAPLPCTCETAREEDQRKQKAREQKRLALMAEKRAHEVQNKRDASRMGKRLQQATFSKAIETAENRHLLTVARRYSAGFKALIGEHPPQKTGLYICGDVGTGKTYLAACIANAILDSNQSVFFSSVLTLQAELKRSYDGHGGTEKEILEQYTRPKLLILDDIGKEPPTAWGLSRLFELVDARNMEQRPMIVTSNYMPQELVKRLTPSDRDATTARAIVDRLMQDCFLVCLKGQSWRAKLYDEMRGK